MLQSILAPKPLAVIFCLKAFKRALYLREIAKFCNLSPRGASIVLKKLCDLKLVSTHEQAGRGSNRRTFFSLSTELSNNFLLSEIAQSAQVEKLIGRSRSYSTEGTVDWIDETLLELEKVKKVAEIS